MRVYIAGPMTGIEDFNYPAFNAAASRLLAAGYEPLNPVDSEKHNDTDTHQTWDWYLRHAIRMVTHADGLAMLPGWSKSKGANLEHHVAMALGLDIRDLDRWLS